MFTLLLVASLTSALLAPLGCLVLWRKYAYFTDGFAHASTLAAVIAISINLPIIYAWIIVSFVYVLLVHYAQKYSDYNSSISLVTSFFLAVTVAVSHNKTNLGSILFGKLSEVNYSHIQDLLIILFINILFFRFFYKKILVITLSKEIAHSAGIHVDKIETLFLILLALSVMFASRIVGAFFVINVMLIPALISKIISSSPVRMLYNAVLISLIPNFFMFLILQFSFSVNFYQYVVEKFSSILIIINIIAYSFIILILKIKNR